jgi:hypothetical protein
MKTNDLIKKAKELQEKTRQRKLDPRYRKVIGFLKGKGLLIDEIAKPRPNVKLDVKDVLWVGEKVEPRVFEVFPAAFLHFPKTFFNIEALPKDLAEIVEAIRLKIPMAPDYKGIETKKMNHWANRFLKDRRVKPITERKIPKNYRLRPQVIEILKKKALEANLSETECLEKLITG